MEQCKLIIGNKNYSSWSLRPWLVLKHTGAPFEEIRIPLFTPGSKAEIQRYSPSGKVPCLIDGTVTLWDSLAICEYLAEKFPAARLWPRDPAARALARSISAEMHAGFPNIRSHFSMNLRRKPVPRPLYRELVDEIRRVEEIWRTCRIRYGFYGPFLFGEFTIADAMYAPMAARFDNFGVAVSEHSRSYMDAIFALPAMRDWKAAALAEQEVVPALEI